MIHVNIKNFSPNIIIVTTPENASKDLEAEIKKTILKAMQDLQVQDSGHLELNSDKSEPQQPNH